MLIGVVYLPGNNNPVILSQRIELSDKDSFLNSMMTDGTHMKILLDQIYILPIIIMRYHN